MSKKGSFHSENFSKNHVFGDLDKNEKRNYENLGKAWINTTRWLLQENLYWPISNTKFN
jgi:hypothetical protein